MYMLMNSILISMYLFMMLFMMMLLVKESVYMSINISTIFSFNINFSFDIISIIFSMVVLLISVSVYYYSKTYFMYKMNMNFKLSLLFFVMSMMVLLSSESMVLVIISWDILGISSFYLIMFYNNMEASISSLVTFLFNRLGDSMIIVLSSIMLYNMMSVSLLNFNKILFMFAFGCSITKSAQIPFGVWLPMAMSAPTPISSLVHSSTLVTAGIFLLIKFNTMFIMKEIQMIIMIFGTMTFFFSGFFSVYILDLKKAIAFSTLSQLGMMMFMLSLGKVFIVFIHLVFHALFKSLLFMNLGMMMMKNFSIQDLRLLKINNINFLVSIPYMISSFSLMGLVFTIGFMSKDIMLIEFMLSFNKMLILLLIFSSCLMTICYSIKFFLIFFQFSLVNIKMYKMMKMNLYFIMLILISILCIFFASLFFELANLMLNNYLSSYMKLSFYLMVFMSLILVKMLMNLKLTMYKSFSSMLNILDIFNSKINFILVKLINLMMFMLFMEEYWQVNLLKTIFMSKKTILLKLSFLFSFPLTLYFIMMMLY